MLLAAKRDASQSVYEQQGDEELYRRFAQGDKDAFAILLDRYGSRVFGYFARFFGDKELANDMTQEVFIRVITAAGEFRGESSFATFIFRVARNLCIDVMRSKAARPDAASLDAETEGQRPLRDTVPGSSPAGEDRAFSGELSTALEAALGSLPPEQREVFLMREFQGLRFAEIASILGVNENTVKSRMHYAVMHLRAALSDFWGSR